MESDGFFSAKRPKPQRSAAEDDDDRSESANEKRLRLAKQLVASSDARQLESEAAQQQQQHVAARLQHRQLQTITATRGHTRAVTCVAIGGATLATAGKDGSIVKWRLATAEKLAHWGYKRRRRGSKRKDAAEGDKARENKGHRGAILALALSHDERILVSGGEDHNIVVWNYDNHQCIKVLKGHRGAVYCLAFRIRTRTLFSGSQDRTVKMWNLEEMAYIETLFGHQEGVQGIDCLQRERPVSCGGRDRTLRSWKVLEESQLVFQGHGHSLDCVAMISDKVFLSGDQDGSLCLWDIGRKKPTFTIPKAHGADHWISAVAAVKYGDLAASGSNDGVLRLWRLNPNQKGLFALMTVPVVGFVNGLAFNADGSFLVAAVGQDHRLGRWDLVKEARNGSVILDLREGNLRPIEGAEAGEGAEEPQQNGHANGEV